MSAVCVEKKKQKKNSVVQSVKQDIKIKVHFSVKSTAA